MSENNLDPARVMIVAPVSSLRVGLKTILAGTPWIEIVAEAASLDDAGGLPPQVEIVLIAILENPPYSRLRALLTSNPQVNFLFLLNPVDSLPVVAIPANRELGLLNLNAPPEEIGAAIVALNAGLSVIDPQLMGGVRFIQESTGTHDQETDRLPAVFDQDQDSFRDTLTGREVEILQALAGGLTNKEIARLFAISEHTVKYHIASIYSKLGVNNRTEAVRQGVHLGIITI